jgi:carbamoyl-phosphate synthase large subunit
LSISHFRELEVWQLAMALAKTTYQLTSQFPPEEQHGLMSQLRRSAVSIPSNIVEGNALGSTRDYARFIAVALGSTAELQTQLLLSRDLGLADKSLNKVLELCDRVGQMLLGLHQALIDKLQPESRAPSPGNKHA